MQSLKTIMISNRILALSFAFFIFLFSPIILCAEKNDIQYTVFEGDIDNDNNIDFLLKGKDAYIPIVTKNITIPIILKKPSILISSDNQGHFLVTNIISESLEKNPAWRPSSSELLPANINTDSHIDYLLTHPTENSLALALMGNHEGQLSTGMLINQNLIESEIYGIISSLIINDNDGDGQDEIILMSNNIPVGIIAQNENSIAVDTAFNAPSTLQDNADQRWTYLSDSNTDVLNPIPSNPSGISVNRLSNSLNLSDKNMMITNLPGTINTTKGDISYPAAKTIVLIAPEISLANKIEIVGSRADLVLISESPTAELTCVDCHFENFYLISVITPGAPVNINYLTTDLGEFSAGKGTSAKIVGLHAPSLLALDIITDSINHDLTIDLNAYVSKASMNGSLVVDDQALETVGSGMVNLLLGPNRWRYSDNTLLSTITTAQNSEQIIAGKISAKTIRIGTFGDLNISADVSTFSDYTSTTSYKGSIFVPEESVDFQSINGSLEISGIINSDGEVRFKAQNNIDLKQIQKTRTAGTIKAVAGNRVKLYSDKKLIAGNIYITAKDILNNGMIDGLGIVELHASTSLINQFGGEVFGGELLISTDRFLNGSIYGNSLDLLPTSHSNILPKNSDFNWTQHANTDVSIGLYNHIIDNTDIARVNSDLNYKSHIAGNTVSILANDVVNCNPHFNFLSETMAINKNREQGNTVVIYAENNLHIKSKNRIINASAQMAVSSNNGVLNLSAPRIVNDRFRIAFELDYTTKNDEEDNPYQLLFTKPVIYSPSGLIRSSGSVVLSNTFDNGNLGIFLNQGSYIEAFGEIKTSNIDFFSFGFSNEALQAKTVIKNTASIELLNFFNIKISLINNSIEETVGLGTNIVDELDSLIYAGNGLKSQNGATQITTISALDVWINNAVTSYIENNYNHSYVSNRFDRYISSPKVHPWAHITHWDLPNSPAIIPRSENEKYHFKAVINNASANALNLLKHGEPLIVSFSEDIYLQGPLAGEYRRDKTHYWSYIPAIGRSKLPQPIYWGTAHRTSDPVPFFDILKNYHDHNQHLLPKYY